MKDYKDKHLISSLEWRELTNRAQYDQESVEEKLKSILILYRPGYSPEASFNLKCKYSINNLTILQLWTSALKSSLK